ncbi:MAG: formylglycine-generating enzyme family protein [Candidatus Cloacimonetes bacterium]|nr:formylglycine-generating enzyme family protein [Candidatus Cloacimonadota bacterium]
MKKVYLLAAVITIFLMFSCTDNTTETNNENEAPWIPTNPLPINGSTDINISPALSWSCSDPEGDSLSYDVYFGIVPAPGIEELVSVHQSEKSYNPDTLQFETTYYWKIVADDGELNSTSEVWSFSTEAEGISDNLITVQGGSFQMGDTHGSGDADELPVHAVTLSSFRIGKYEVTHQEVIDVYNWALDNNHIYYENFDVLNSTGDPEVLLDLNDSDCAIEFIYNALVFSGSVYAASPEYPCIEITWFGAAAYCNFLSIIQNFDPCYNFVDWSCNQAANGYRIPTEAEWEFAARGGVAEPDYIYSGSDICSDVAWFTGNSTSNTHIAGLRQANGLGIFDMSGNVWEWCNDWYSATYYDISPVDNPAGPETGTGRVMRGGSFSSDDFYCRVSFRGSNTPFSSNENRGFRICRTHN